MVFEDVYEDAHTGRFLDLHYNDPFTEKDYYNASSKETRYTAFTMKTPAAHWLQII
jgi:hypothetical protein